MSNTNRKSANARRVRNNSNTQQQRRGPRNVLVRVPGRFRCMPPMFEADFENVFVCYVSTGGCTNNAFSINIAAFHAPFSAVSNTILGTTGVTPFDGNATQGSNINQDYIGFGAMLQLYNRFVVLSNEISVTAQPQNAGDSISHALFPTGAQESPTSGSWNYVRAAGQNQAKLGVVATGVPPSMNTLRLRCNPYEGLGLTRQQWLADGVTSMGASPSLASYVVYYCGTSDGAGSAAPVTFNVRLKDRVRMMDPLQFNS